MDRLRHVQRDLRNAIGNRAGIMRYRISQIVFAEQTASGGDKTDRVLIGQIDNLLRLAPWAGDADHIIDRIPLCDRCGQRTGLRTGHG